MGSVKDLITPENAVSNMELFAAQLYRPPQPHAFGLGAWKCSGRFSVADLKDLIPDVEIPDKKYILPMMTAAYFEHIASRGVLTTYEGMMDKDGKVVSVNDLISRGDFSEFIVMKLANTPRFPHDATIDEKRQVIKDYHTAINDGSITVYVADSESVFRAGLPLGSSTFKKIFKAAGRGDIYESLATYDQTAAVLEEIKRDVHSQGLVRFKDLWAILNDIGVKDIPFPGQMFDKIALNFDTKFELAGDLPIETDEEAARRMGVAGYVYDIWKTNVRNCAEDQIEFSRKRGIINIDGKVEGVVVKTQSGPTLYLADFANTPDENRLMITYEKDGITYMIPANKEIARAKFRELGIYAACDAAKAEAVHKEGSADNWRAYIFNHTTKEKLAEATQVSTDLQMYALREVANRTFRDLAGKDVFTPTVSIDTWVDGFLPYASRVQPDYKLK